MTRPGKRPGIASGERMDYTLQKAVELGIARIQPLALERSVVKLAGERAEKRTQHWQNVVIAACEQCGRARVPQVLPPLTLAQWLAAPHDDALRLMLQPDSDTRLRDLPVLLVTLQPPFEVLQERVANRAMGGKIAGSQYASSDAAQRARERLHRLRPWFYQTIYANDCSDLLIDTEHHAPEEVCAQIERRLATGPGTAFEQLRQRYAEFTHRA